MSMLYTFWWGFFGSVAVEVINLYQIYQSNTELPEMYKKRGYWIVRVLLAIVAGGLAISYEIDKPLLAANIGAATPLIIQALGKVKPSIS